MSKMDGTGSNTGEKSQNLSNGIGMTVEELEKSLEKPDSQQDAFHIKEARITSQEMIRRYGERIRELCEHGENGRKITYKELAKVCGISSQAISDIVKGKVKSVNMDYCHRLAQYFGCTDYYMVGLTESKNGVLTDKQEFNVPITFFNAQEAVDITQAAKWAHIDEKLFRLLEKLFHTDEKTRLIIYQSLKLMLKGCED